MQNKVKLSELGRTRRHRCLDGAACGDGYGAGRREAVGKEWQRSSGSGPGAAMADSASAWAHHSTVHGRRRMHALQPALAYLLPSPAPRANLTTTRRNAVSVSVAVRIPEPGPG